MINCCTYICETKSLDGGKSFDFVLTNQDIMKVSKVVVVTNKTLGTSLIYIPMFLLSLTNSPPPPKKRKKNMGFNFQVT